MNYILQICNRGRKKNNKKTEGIIPFYDILEMNYNY